MKRIISIWILLLCAGISKVQAQNDATLAGMILVYTNKAEKELKNQEKVMLMQTTGHVWTKEEVEGTTDLQREFNNYLNSFRSIVCYAAQIYGFYHEISQLTDNMGDFTKQGTAVSPKRPAKNICGLHDAFARPPVQAQQPYQRHGDSGGQTGHQRNFHGGGQTSQPGAIHEVIGALDKEEVAQIHAESKRRRLA